MSLKPNYKITIKNENYSIREEQEWEVDKGT